MLSTCKLAFLECSQMSEVFYHSVVHGRLRPLRLYKFYTSRVQTIKHNKTRFSYVLYSDKTWLFDQPEHMQGPIDSTKL